MTLELSSPLLVVGQSAAWVEHVCARYRAAFGVRAGRTYSLADLERICWLYQQACLDTALNVQVVLAQVFLETGGLTSAWSQPPGRNPAGIGVTGEPGRGVQFPSWPQAVDAHTGRVLAYRFGTSDAMAPPTGARVFTAMAYRPLPASLRGSSSTLGQLASHWAASGAYASSLIGVDGRVVG